MTKKELFKQLTEIYGFEAQRDKWIEELLELATALQQSKTKGKNTDGHIEEEIGDVLLCIEQMKMFYNFSMVENWQAEKLRVLPKKLNLGKYTEEKEEDDRPDTSFSLGHA